MNITKNIALLLCFCALANAKTTAAEDDLLLGDLPIVISASRLNQSVITSPSSVTVIDKAMIEASGFIEFADLLRLVPGFQVAHVDGRRYSVVYHGNGSEISNRIQVLVNGRSTYTPTLSTVNWDSLGLQLEDIERIEVVRGTSASAYGSNSFTAAINIITKSPELDDQFHLKERLGNHGERYSLLRVSDSQESFHYRLTAAHRKSDGFDDYDDSKKFNSLGFHGRFYTAKNDPVNLFLSYTDGETDTRENSNELLDRDRDITSWSAHIQGSNILSNLREIQWNIYHNRDNINDLSQTRLLSEIFSDALDTEITPEIFETTFGTPDTRTIEGSETNDSSKSDIEISYHSSEYQNLQYVLGSGLRYDTLKSPSYFREQGRLEDTSYRLFGNIQSPVTQELTINAGLFYEYTLHYGGRTSPRASLNWQLAPNQSIRIAAARGYRLPSLLEKNFDTRTTLTNGFIIDERFISDENLKPEKITTYDIAYLGKLNNLPIKWDIKIYQEKIEDIISFTGDSTFNGVFDDEFRLITNGGEIDSYGMEGEISYRPSNHSFVNLHFNIGKSTYAALTETNPNTFETSDRNTPRKSFGLSSGLLYQKWQFNMGIYYVGNMKWFSQGQNVDSYTRLDTSVSRIFKMSKNNIIKVKFAYQNKGNKHAEFGNNNDISNDFLLFEPRYYFSVEFRSP